VVGKALTVRAMLARARPSAAAVLACAAMTTGPRFDAAGWAIDPVQPWPGASAWTLFAKGSDARIDPLALDRWARDLAGASARIEPEKSYVRGGAPLADAATIHLVGEGDRCDAPLGASRVVLVMLPASRARDLVGHGLAAAARIGGAGMDAVVRQAGRIAQISADFEGDPRAPLVAAAALSAAWLAAIVPPEGDGVFANKGARERLARAGLAPR
jgi:hypothetical protein